MSNKKGRMLVVDDIKMSRSIVKNVFSDEYDIIEAANGSEALDQLELYQGQIDIVIMDIIMPEVNGLTTIKLMKENSLFRDIPIIVITSLNDVDNEVSILDLGVSDIVIKPYNNMILKKKVKLLEKNKLYDKLKLENNLLKSQKIAEIQLDTIINKLSSGIALFEFGVYLKPLYCNDTFKEYFKLVSSSDYIVYNQDFFQVIFEKDRQMVYEHCKNAIDTNTRINIEYRIVKDDEKIFWSNCQGIKIPYPNSNLPVILCVFTDVTRLKDTEQSLLDTTIQLSTLVNNVPCGYAIFKYDNGAMSTIYGNNHMFEMYGLNDTLYEMTMGKDYLRFIYPNDYVNFVKELNKAKSNCDKINISYRVIGYDKKIYYSLLRGQFLKNSNNDLILYALILDITKEKLYEDELCKKNEEIRYRADHDSLTGIYNASTFVRETEKLIKDNPNEKYCIFRLNIEKFRLFNDLFGSTTADLVLIKIAQVLLSELDGIGRYARFETDHFVGCLPSRLFFPENFLDKLQKNIEKVISISRVTIDLGIYEIDDLSVPVSVMCDRAYLALQTIKGKYGIRYTYYDNIIRDKMLEEQEIESEMQNALDNNQFIIYLQPIYSISKMQPRMAEALVRWEHPTKGIIPPNKFIPIFEKNGFIAKMDYYVWDLTCKYIRSRIDRKMIIYPISINISRMSLYQHDLAERILGLTKKYQIDTSLLHLEITESAYNDNPVTFLEILYKLREYGFTILMDDFGSGYSSLNALKELPINIIKMDMKFLENVESSSRASTIFMSIVRMAKWLDFDVIAEGVETLHQIEFLKSIGCDDVQGYYFYKPMKTTDYDKEIPQTFVTISNNNYFSVEDLNVLFDSDHILSKIMENTFELVGFYELHDDKLEVIRINNKYFDIMGYNHEEYFSSFNMINNHIHHEDYQKVIDAFRKAYETKIPQQLIIRKYHSNGHIIYIDTIFRFVAGNSERILVLATGNDVTKQYQRETEITKLNNEIIQKEELLLSICDTIPNSFIVVNEDSELSIYQMNSVTWKLLKLDKSKYNLLAKELYLSDIIIPECYDKIKHIIEKVYNTGETCDCCLKLKPIEKTSLNSSDIELEGKIGFIQLSNNIKKILFNLSKKK